MNRDIPVLILFFIRPKPLSRVLEKVKMYKPKKLYLFQDGPREDHDDVPKIMECREVVENIDWDCQVYRNYSSVNLGCDPATYEAISWVLRDEEYVIRLEDDHIANPSFFQFCEELLHKYRNDKRVFMITGRNQLGMTSYLSGGGYTPSYFFASVDNIWGFATWKDRWELLDPAHNFLNDKTLVDMIYNQATNKFEIDLWLKRCEQHRISTLQSGKIASYESAIRAAMLLNNMLCIVPQTNMIKNIGATEDAVHTPVSVDSIMKKDRFAYELNDMETKFPLVHPQTVINNVDFYDKRNELFYWDSRAHRNIHLMQLAMRNRMKKIAKMFKIE